MHESVREANAQERAFEEQIRRFGEIVVADKSIQMKLTSAIDRGVSRDEWVLMYVGIARDHGLTFTADQLKIAMQEQKQGKDKILPTMVQKWISFL